MAVKRIARVSVGHTNQNPLALLDVARRQVDHLGPVGICAKRGQTNGVYLRRGYLRFVFPTRAMRWRFIHRVRLCCHPAITVRRFKQ